MKSIYIMIAHGSKDAEANTAFEGFVTKFRKAYPKKYVEGAFLELAKPSISEVIERAALRGINEFFIIPLMVFPGRHVKKDIPEIIKQAKAKYPAVDFHYAGPLSEQPLFLKLLGQKSKMRRGLL